MVRNLIIILSILAFTSCGVPSAAILKDIHDNDKVSQQIKPNKEYVIQESIAQVFRDSISEYRKYSSEVTESEQESIIKNIFKYSKQNNVDPILVFDIIRKESGFNRRVQHQRTKCTGLGGIAPIAFKHITNEYDLDHTFSELKKIDVNIKYITLTLRYLIDHYDGDMNKALYQYSGGSKNYVKARLATIARLNSQIKI